MRVALAKATSDPGSELTPLLGANVLAALIGKIAGTVPVGVGPEVRTAIGVTLLLG